MARGKLAFDHLDILSENKDNDGKLLHIFRIVLLVIMGLISFRCCGASGDVNSSTSWFLYQHDSFWVRDDLSNRSLVPKSCCSEDSNMELCTGKVNMTNSTIFSSWAPYGEPEKVDPPLTYNYTIFTDGCYDKLEGYLRQNGILIGTAAIVVGVFMIIEIVCTIFEYRRLKF
ncbi:hypothetical protein MAR_036832 [Mya arenaria]|uniref:Uncharacterized protein n=1 Tax=Mya arenaria TaxID=6604 RepID=A0ABY7FLS7_MYAAR|nr:hypothetical protein MAR_036832 [Mya arenaria]